MGGWWVIPAFIVGVLIGINLGMKAVSVVHNSIMLSMGKLIDDVTEVRDRSHDGRVDPTFIVTALSLIRSEITRERR